MPTVLIKCQFLMPVDFLLHSKIISAGFQAEQFEISASKLTTQKFNRKCTRDSLKMPPTKSWKLLM